MKIYLNIINYRGEKIQKHKLFENYLSKINDIYKSDKDRERIRLSKYYNLYEYSNDTTIQSNLRTKLLETISKLKNKTITKLDTFFLSTNFNFGNNLIIVNNAIFYCEVLGCNKIILNRFNLRRRWLILEPVYIKRLNITIMQGSNIDCKKNNILCLYEISSDFFSPKIIMPQVRINLIKDEILKNLPYVFIEQNAVYIHIRGGDIFKPSPSTVYGQPPLCFYEKIINQTNFKKIFIISMDNSNVIINILKKKYKNIIHKMNNFEYDISLLSHAYNIVLSVSSFVISAIKLNNNLKEIWEYDIMKLSQKLLFLHHHIFKYKIQYKMHTMEPSANYISKMFSWKRTKEQIRLMLEDDCPNEFVVTKTKILN